MHAYDKQSLPFRLALGGVQWLSDPTPDRHSPSTRAKRALSPVRRTGPTFSHHPLSLQTQTSNNTYSRYFISDSARRDWSHYAFENYSTQQCSVPPVVADWSGAEKPKPAKLAETNAIIF
jgi:hypothetical protein